MIETQTSLVAASSCTAASVSTTCGPSGAPAASAAAISVTDVLVMALDPAGVLLGAFGVGAGLAGACRPRREPAQAGWATTSADGSAASSSRTTGGKSSTSKSPSSASKTSGPLGFLNDPKLSVEDKLFKFMCYVADKYDKAIEKKLNEIANKQSGSSSSSSASGSSKGSGGGLLGGLLGGGGGGGGGLLGGVLGGGGGLGGLLGGGGGSGGGLGGILGSVCPAAGIGLDLLQQSGIQDLVTQLSGPVLAAGASVLGFPEFAPMLLQAGPELTQGAFGLLNSAAGGSGGSPGSSKGTSSSKGSSSSASSGSSGGSSASSSDGDPKIEQKDMLELQRLQDKQKEMFSLVSNMLRSMHDTKMAVINNLRA